MARPTKPIDKELVGRLAAYGWTIEEIGELVGCSRPTLYRRFVSSLKSGRAKLKQSLRKQQVLKAEEGNVTMLIWLGKQYLDQRDSPLEIQGNLKTGVTTINVTNVDTNSVIQAMMALDRLKVESQSKGKKTRRYSD